MQEAAGATPPRQNLWLYYGRDISEKRVASILAILAEQTWDTDTPPAAASASLLETAQTVIRMLSEEHNVTLYDPHCWTRIACWFGIRICTLILDNRLQEANDLLCTKDTLPTFFLPACRFRPALCAIAPSAGDDAIKATRDVVCEYTRFMAARVDNLYQRALVELYLNKLPDRRNRVYDGHASLVLIDAVFTNDEDVIETDHVLYAQLREFVLSRPQEHYDGHTKLAYLPHLHAMCRWITYANQLGQCLKIVLSVNNSRCREATADITGMCWVSEHACGYFSPREQLMTDATDVWDLLVLLNRRYVPA